MAVSKFRVADGRLDVDFRQMFAEAELYDCVVVKHNDGNLRPRLVDCQTTDETRRKGRELVPADKSPWVSPVSVPPTAPVVPAVMSHAVRGVEDQRQVELSPRVLLAALLCKQFFPIFFSQLEWNIQPDDIISSSIVGQIVQLDARQSLLCV